MRCSRRSASDESAPALIGSGIDTLTSIENLTGSLFDDVLTGSSSSNVLIGL
jgi:hypothetical protein